MNYDYTIRHIKIIQYLNQWSIIDFKKSKVTMFKTNLYSEDSLIKLYSQMTSSFLNSSITVSYLLAHKFNKLNKRHQNQQPVVTGKLY